VTPGARQSILIVDDIPMNIKMLAAGLKDEHRILVANSGEKALELIRSGGPPDMVLLDVMMPGMDGFTACGLLKENERTRDVPVLVITAHDNPEDQVRGLAAGAVDCITTPFVIPAVKARVRAYLALKRKSELLEEIAMLDGLTEIFNRRSFEDALQREWRRNSRGGTPVALILAGTDHFKEYKAKYGLGAGDTCLRRVAMALRESVGRPGDVVARYGDEAFAALLPETELDQARRVADKMRHAVSDLHIPRADSTTGRVAVSLGLAAMTPTPDASPQDLVNAATTMLYKAKSEGRNRAAW